MANYNLYYLYKKKRRKKGTQEWEDIIPTTYSIDGDGTMTPQIAEYNSEQCGYQPDCEISKKLIPEGTICEECGTPPPMTFIEWREVQGEHLCYDANKYKSLRKWVSDDLITWKQTDEYTIGEIIEQNSAECGYMERTIIEEYCEDMLPI